MNADELSVLATYIFKIHPVSQVWSNDQRTTNLRIICKHEQVFIHVVQFAKLDEGCRWIRVNIFNTPRTISSCLAKMVSSCACFSDNSADLSISMAPSFTSPACKGTSAGMCPGPNPQRPFIFPPLVMFPLSGRRSGLDNEPMWEPLLSERCPPFIYAELCNQMSCACASQTLRFALRAKDKDWSHKANSGWFPKILRHLESW